MTYPPDLARADRLLTGEELREKYGIEHPMYLRRDWQQEVLSENTLRGYWEWVCVMCEEEP